MHTKLFRYIFLFSTDRIPIKISVLPSKVRRDFRDIECGNKLASEWMLYKDSALSDCKGD